MFDYIIASVVPLLTLLLSALPLSCLWLTCHSLSLSLLISQWVTGCITDITFEELPFLFVLCRIRLWMLMHDTVHAHLYNFSVFSFSAQCVDICSLMCLCCLAACWCVCLTSLYCEQQASWHLSKDGLAYQTTGNTACLLTATALAWGRI